MPYRLAAAIEPLAKFHAREVAPALEALCAHACAMTGLSAALVAQGVAPGMAHLLARQWHATGATLSPELRAALAGGVYAPAFQAIPGITGIPAFPGIAGIPAVPGLAGMPIMAGMPGAWLTGIPAMPGLAGITAGLVPRFALPLGAVDPD